MNMYEYVWIEEASKADSGLKHAAYFGVARRKGIMDFQSTHMAQPILSAAMYNRTVGGMEMR